MRSTLPRLWDRALRDLKRHHKSYKSTESMCCILATGEAISHGRIPDVYCETSRLLCHLRRLRIHPEALSSAELVFAVNHPKKFFAACTGASIASS